MLDHGAIGRVYRAQATDDGRTHAVKVLFGQYAAEPSLRERFRREAQAMARIRHRNIVHVEDFGTTREGLIFLVLELVIMTGGRF